MRNNYLEKKSIVKESQGKEITDAEAQDIENRMDVLSNYIIDMWLEKTPEERKEFIERYTIK